MHEAAFALQQGEVERVRGAVVDPAHHLDVVDHAATHDARFDQAHESVVDHFARAVQPDRERIDAAVLAHQPAFGEAWR